MEYEEALNYNLDYNFVKAKVHRESKLFYYECIGNYNCIYLVIVFKK